MFSQYGVALPLHLHYQLFDSSPSTAYKYYKKKTLTMQKHRLVLITNASEHWADENYVYFGLQLFFSINSEQFFSLFVSFKRVLFNYRTWVCIGTAE